MRPHRLVAAAVLTMALATACGDQKLVWGAAPSVAPWTATTTRPPTPPTRVVRTPTAAAAAPTSSPPAPRTTFSEGVYAVGVDIQPGQYRSPGGAACYWARLDANEGIIDNYIGNGPSILNVRASDAYIELSRCTWTKSG